jgi:membrane-associated HD superfamily phosphohydrolase
VKSSSINTVVFFLSAISLFLSTYKIGQYFYERQYGAIRSDISWGIIMKFALIVFVVIAIFVGGLQIIARKFWHKLIVSSVAFAIFCIFFFGNYTYLPYRTSLLLVSSLAGLFLPILIIYFLSWRKPKTVG